MFGGIAQGKYPLYLQMMVHIVAGRSSSHLDDPFRKQEAERSSAFRSRNGNSK